MRGVVDVHVWEIRGSLVLKFAGNEYYRGGIGGGSGDFKFKWDVKFNWHVKFGLMKSVHNCVLCSVFWNYKL